MKYHTAPSYEKLQKVGEPYCQEDKWYINVILKSGKEKTVRAYIDPEPWNARKCLGFSTTGYITIFKGEISMEDPYFNKSPARWHKWWGWYFIGEEPLPTDIPAYAEPKLLYWNSVGNDDNTLKDEKTVIKEVNKLIF